MNISGGCSAIFLEVKWKKVLYQMISNSLAKWFRIYVITTRRNILDFNLTETAFLHDRQLLEGSMEDGIEN
jgi:hypothetical protein